MNQREWEKLNYEFHRIHHNEESEYNSSQRWFNQALMLHLMKKHHLIGNTSWLDYASGEGYLSIQLKENFGLHLWNYDKYITPLINQLPHYKTSDQFNLVVSCAYFEHVRGREHLDIVNSHVSTNGCLAVHTLVRGAIPKDPNWFYLLPVHTSFHTNKSMGLLMASWGFTCSVYNEHSQLWVMFKSDPEKILNKVNTFNKTLGWEYLHFKKGFMDYWT
jgi:hypothetical protein